jgi:hypothetical protein
VFDIHELHWYLDLQLLFVVQAVLLHGSDQPGSAAAVVVAVVVVVALVRVNDIFGCYEFGLVDVVSLSRFSYDYISIIFIDLLKLCFEII